MALTTGQNTQPIYSAVPHFYSTNWANAGVILGPSASTSQNGAEATNIYQIFQAGANGSYVQKVRFRPIGSPAGTVGRLFICNTTGSGAFTAGTTNTATTTGLVTDISLPAITLSQTVQAPEFESVWNFALQGGTSGGYRILVSFGTSTGSAGTGYTVDVIAGDY